MTSVACLVAQSPDNTTGLLDSLKECRPVKQTALLQAGPATTPAGSYTTTSSLSPTLRVVFTRFFLAGASIPIWEMVISTSLGRASGSSVFRLRFRSSSASRVTGCPSRKTLAMEAWSR